MVARALRTETVGGPVLLAAALVALVWANSSWGGTYEAVRDFLFGISALWLDLSVGHWAADGLLAVFSLVAGIELKRELVVGELRTPAIAARSSPLCARWWSPSGVSPCWQVEQPEATGRDGPGPAAKVDADRRRFGRGNGDADVGGVDVDPHAPVAAVADRQGEA